MTTPPDPPVAVPGPASATCPNPRCNEGWVERGDNESGGAPAFPCRTEGCPYAPPGPASVSPAEPPELAGLRKLYGQKFNAIGAALGHATEAQAKLDAGDVDAAAEEIAKVVSILVDA